MESKSVQPFLSRQTVVLWANLPSELLTVIAGDLKKPTDIARFRSVCRSWRFSISPPPLSPNKISPLFPRRVSFCIHAEFGCRSKKKYLIAGAVYLFCPRADPSKAWIVSAQESRAGKLRLRHALTRKKIPNSSGTSIDLSEWSITLLAMSYSFRLGRRRCDQSTEICSTCDCVVRDAKVIHNSDDMAVYNFGPSPDMRLYSLSINGSTGATECVIDEDDEEDSPDEIGRIEDFINFNGRIYAVNQEDNLYLFDSTKLNLQLLQMNSGSFRNLIDVQGVKRFVVSDGELYLVSYFTLEPLKIKIYKLVMDNTDATRCNSEKVEDLGDRVFFITRDCSFSVSDRDLPRTLKGNCVVVGKGVFPLCDEFPLVEDMTIFHLGGKRPQFKAYYALFTPPSLWINQLHRVDSGKRREEEVAESCPRIA